MNCLLKYDTLLMHYIDLFPVTNLIGGIGSIGTSFTTDVWDFILCRFIVGLSFDNCFMVLYVLGKYFYVRFISKRFDD